MTTEKRVAGAAGNDGSLPGRDAQDGEGAQAHEDRDRSLADRVVEELLSEGDSDQAIPGRFALDREVARRKLRDFQVEDPWSYPLDLVSAAVRQGARRIDIVSDGRRFSMRFDGQPFDKQDFLDLYDALFTGGDSPGVPARRHLARAIGAAQSLGVAEVRVRSGGGGEGGASLVAKRDGQDDIGEPDPVPEGTQVEILHDRKSRDGLSAAQAKEALDRVLRERGIYTGIQVTLNDEALPDGWSLPGSTDRLSFGDAHEGGSLRGVIGVLPTVGQGELRLVLDGVLVQTLHSDELPIGFVGLVSDARFRTDLSRGAVLKGPALDGARTAATEAGLALTERLGHDHVELSYYEPQSASRYFLSDAKKPSPPPVSIPDFYLQVQGTGAGRALDRVKWALRLSSKALYLSPVLIAPKLVLWLLGNPAGDYLTVAFVCLVVVFFALINVFLVLHFVAGPRSERKKVMRWVRSKHTVAHALRLLRQDPPRPPSDGELAELTRGVPAARPLRLHGRILRTGGRQTIDEAVLRDTFCLHGDHAARLTAFHHFALVLPDRPGDPLHLNLPVMPWIAEEYDLSSLPPGLHPYHYYRLAEVLHTRDLPEGAQTLLEEGHSTVLWPDDEIELIVPAGARIRPLAGETFAGVRSRGDTAGPPCIIRRLVATGARSPSAPQGQEGFVISGSAQ